MNKNTISGIITHSMIISHHKNDVRHRGEGDHLETKVLTGTGLHEELPKTACALQSLGKVFSPRYSLTPVDYM